MVPSPKDLPKGDDLDELSASATQARTEMVQKVLEGLREEAFELARDVGVDVLTQPGGLRKFVKKLRDVVFPRASEEARELFKAGQKPGSLARQNGESMLSYVSRRRRWWKLLKTLDGSIELSEPMRVELLLELSGLSRQEIIVIKACAPDAKSFESVAATLVEQYSGVHLRAGRSLGQPNLRNSGNLQSKSSRPSGYRPKGKGKTYRAYTADAWYEEDPIYEEDQEQEEDFHEASYQVFDEDTAPGYPEDPEGDGEDYEDYELSESEAIALNCLEELEESSEAGHAVQLQLAAHAAFGKAKGKGKGKSKKGKGKGKGKVVRSHLTLERRRDKLKSLKAKSKCMRCGALGHWAGGKGKAHLAVIADEGLSIPAGNDTAAAFVARAKSSAAPPAAAAKPIAAPSHEPRAMAMEGGDKKFYLGQHRNETYSEVAKKIEFIQWLMAQSDLSMQNKDFLTWFNRYYTIQDGSVQARASLGLPEGAYIPKPRKTGIRKTPPNPPLPQKCALCKDFTYSGSTVTYIRSTCRDCGHVEQKPREVTYTHDPATCRHEVVDRRSSSRTISRTFCKQCGTFIDEVPGEFHAQRRTAASKVLDATSNALDVINAMTTKEAVTDYSPEAVEAILGAFNDRVLQAIQDEDRVDDIVLHDHLREAIVKTVEDPDSPWSDVGRTSPTPVAMMVYDEHGEPVFDTTGMPYSKAKAKAFGKGPRAVIWPPYQGTRVDPVVRSNLMIAHWAAFANRLLRKYARKYMFKFWRIEKRRRAIIMHENMARRTLIRTNPQLGPFRPVDIYECSSDSDDEPTISVARASSDAPTAAPGLPRQPVARIDRALDVLNAPGSTRQEFQAYFNPRNLGPGDLEELSPELWEELRLDGAVDEYDLHMQDMAEEEAQGTESDLDRPPGLSEAAIAGIPRTTLAGLEARNPALYRDIVIGIQAARDRDPRDPESPLISEPGRYQPGSHRPGEAPGTSSSSRTAQGRRWQPRPPHGGPHNVALAGCDVSYQSDFVRVDTLPVVDMWSPEEDHIWGALDEACNSTCHSKAWGELAEDRLRAFDLTFPWMVLPRVLQG